MKNRNSGFTIIELIVVIAIISVLATIVLVSVSSYFSKSKDAAIKANLSSTATASAAYFDANGNYDDLCSDTTTGFLYAFNAADAKKKAGGSSHCVAGSDDAGWIVSVQLNNPSGGNKNGWWCVDSTGVKKEVSTDPEYSPTCP